MDLLEHIWTDPFHILEQNPTTEDVDEFGKVGAEMFHLQSQMHSDYDSAESIADSDLEDGELRKMLASPQRIVNHFGYQLHQ